MNIIKKHKNIIAFAVSLLIVSLCVVCFIFFQSKTLPKKLSHIVIIMEENRAESSIVDNPKASYINKLMQKGSTATNYRAISKNPYIALTSGAVTNIPNSCNPIDSKCETNIANITDQIEKSGRT